MQNGMTTFLSYTFAIFLTIQPFKNYFLSSSVAMMDEHVPSCEFSICVFVPVENLDFGDSVLLLCMSIVLNGFFIQC